MNVYELLEINEMIERIDELTDDENLADERNELLAKLNELIKTSTDKIYEAIKYNQNQIDFLKNYRDEVIKRIKSLEKNILLIENTIYDYMTAHEIGTLEGTIAQLKKRKRSQVVEIYNEELIPFEFLKTEQKTVIMKAEISEALKMGEVIDGARLAEGKKSLAIKLI